MIATVATLDRVAVQIAHALAAAHGHTWGRLDLSRIPDESLTSEGIAQACRGQGLIATIDGKEWWPGIDGPSVDDDGGITHSTGSGRFTWTVYPDMVQLYWDRPEPVGNYCQITIDWRGGYPHIPFVDAYSMRDVTTIFARHIEYVLRGTRRAIAAVEAAVPGTSPEWGCKLSEGGWEETVIEALDPYRVDEVGYLRGIAAGHCREGDEASGRADDAIAGFLADVEREAESAKAREYALTVERVTLLSIAGNRGEYDRVLSTKHGSESCRVYSLIRSDDESWNAAAWHREAYPNAVLVGFEGLPTHEELYKNGAPAAN